MKIILGLIAILTGLYSQYSHAEPIIIWPAEVDHEIIYTEEIVGTWFAVVDNVLCSISFEENQEGQIKIYIHSENSKLKAVGELRPDGNTFYGHIDMDHRNQSLGAILFRYNFRTKLRIVMNDQKYFDLLLFR
ncbi:MAG: hypothetical protein ACXVCA_14025 [Bdellovibrio sp.]